MKYVLFEKEAEIIPLPKFNRLPVLSEYPCLTRSDKSYFFVFDKEHRSLPEPCNPKVVISFDELFDSLFTGFSCVPIRICIKIVGIYLERDQVKGLER